MAVVTFKTDDLFELLGKKLTEEDLSSVVPLMGSPLENITEDEVEFEIFPNRPDLISVEGFARALRGYLGLETGLVKYETKKSDFTVTVDPSVAKIRPYLVAAYVSDITLTDYAIESLMQIQEKLHDTMGRKRKKVSIGVYDADTITKKLTYKAMPKDFEFVPLEFKDKFTLDQILSDHPKGTEYAHIVENFDKYPILIDSEGQVLSMPPIINSEETKLTEDTHNLFIDVTGTHYKTISQTLNILVTALTDRGATINQVSVISDNKTVLTPDLNPEKMMLRSKEVDKLTGLKLSQTEIFKLLEKMRFSATAKDKDIEVLVPRYRTDVLHEVDLIEAISIAYGFDKVRPQLPEISTIGKKSNISHDFLRNLMVGFGFQETMSFTLNNPKVNYELLDLEDAKAVKIIQSASFEQNMVRTNTVSSFMQTLKNNRHVELPIKIFEIGKSAKLVNKKAIEQLKLFGGVVSSKTSFTDIKSIVEAILHNLNIDYNLSTAEKPYFIKGRSAKILNNNQNFGYFGEIHPKIISNFEIENPITFFELDVNKLTG